MNTISCLNPEPLSKYYSLGSRLFHAQTFSPQFLANLRIFPKITFHPSSGFYRACDHDFQIQVEPNSKIHAHPEAKPIDSYLTKEHPEIHWPGLGKDDNQYIVLILDASEGKLQFLSTDFPHKTTILKEYRTLEPYRNAISPMVFLIFKQPHNMSALTYIPPLSDLEELGDSVFDLSKFILKNRLGSALIGLNWALINTDAYSIEKNRNSNYVDNCHSLLISKLRKERQYSFVDTFNLGEMDATLSMSFIQPYTEFDVCCTTYKYTEMSIFADPLLDKSIPSIALINEPKVVSLKKLNVIDNYQRNQRDYVVRKAESFTVVLFDAKKMELFWMVSDVSAEGLASGNVKEGKVLVGYKDPSTAVPHQCKTIFLMVFEEPASARKHLSEIMVSGDKTRVKHGPRRFEENVERFFGYNNQKVSSSNYVGSEASRENFNIEEFKSFMKLRLSAMTWFKSCFDEFGALSQISQIVKSNMSNPEVRKKYQQHKAIQIEYFGFPNTEDVVDAKA
uniref:Anaphase-promoting complex subunit 1 n=1 Tax=Rhabditophanes sp. KR3021 TaxID=114890 RepID=A0AC35UDD0_9BILA